MVIFEDFLIYFMCKSGIPLFQVTAKMAEVEQKKKRTFRKFTYRGIDLDQLTARHVL